MKNIKKIVAIAATVGVLGTAGAVFAATAKTPAEVASELTGKTVEQLYEERSEGKTFGTIAKDAGKLDEFKKQMLENKKLILDQRVAEGRITPEKADQTYNAIKENQATCDGTGSAMIGKANGAAFGNGAGQGLGAGKSSGAGQGLGAGAGKGQGTGMRRGMGNRK